MKRLQLLRWGEEDRGRGGQGERMTGGERGEGRMGGKVGRGLQRGGCDGQKHERGAHASTVGAHETHGVSETKGTQEGRI